MWLWGCGAGWRFGDRQGIEASRPSETTVRETPIAVCPISGPDWEHSGGERRPGNQNEDVGAEMEMNVGSITITYNMADDGDMLTDVSVEGELPIVTQLGLLELAKDSILIGTVDDDD